MFPAADEAMEADLEVNNIMGQHNIEAVGLNPFVEVPQGKWHKYLSQYVYLILKKYNTVLAQ